MAYFDVAELAFDSDFGLRVMAVVALEGEKDPNAWLSAHRWEVAAQPGFGDSYAYAKAQNNPAPGKDTSVITDEALLAGVQAVMGGSGA